MVMDPDGNETHYVVDGLGRDRVTIDPLGNRTTRLFAGNYSGVSVLSALATSACARRSISPKRATIRDLSAGQDDTVLAAVGPGDRCGTAQFRRTPCGSLGVGLLA
jgi:hypothetical protein